MFFTKPKTLNPGLVTPGLVFRDVLGPKLQFSEIGMPNISIFIIGSGKTWTLTVQSPHKCKGCIFGGLGFWVKDHQGGFIQYRSCPGGA